MKVIFKKDYIKFAITYKKGAIIYVSEEFAKTLIGSGTAEQYVEPVKKVKQKFKK